MGSQNTATSIFRSIDIILSWRFVATDEIFSSILRQPGRELGELLPKAINRLLIHVGLCNEFRKRYLGNG